MSWVVIKREKWGDSKESFCYGPYVTWSQATEACEKIVQSEIPDCTTSDMRFNEERRFELPGGIGELSVQTIPLAKFTD